MIKPIPFISIVEDETDLLYLFKDALSQIEHVKVFAFSDPMIALEHFQINHENYRCIISDYRMPGLTGIQLLEKVKAINPRVTRMIISAFEVEDELFKKCQCIDKFLRKPIGMTDLVNEVKKHLTTLEIVDR